MTRSNLDQAGQERPASLPLLLLALTVTTGLIDAVSVLGLGRGFTANMTGNVVFLGFALARVPGVSLVRSLAGLGADSSLAGGDNPRFIRRVASVAAMLGGAVAGGMLVLSVGVAWPLAVSGAITLLATLIYVGRASPLGTLRDV